MALQHYIRVSIDSHAGIAVDVLHYNEQGNMSGQDVLEVTDELAALFNRLAGIAPDTEPAPEAEPAPKKKRATKKEKQ